MANIGRYAFANQDGIYRDDVYAGNPSWKETLIIFSKNKGAVFGLIFVLVMVVLAIWGPNFNSYTYDEIQMTRQNMPPRIPGLEKLGIFDGTLKGKNMYEVKGAMDEYYWFGTDALGRDLFTRFCQGTRISLIVAVISAILSLVIGVSYGLVCGYYGGKLDLLMMRIIEIINGIPALVIVSLLVVILKPGLTSIIVAMAINGWTSMARLVRANTLRIKQQEHIMASKTLGSSVPTILFREIFPNLLSSVIVMAMMEVPGAIFMESFLSFVGLGIPNPQASLGSLISDGYNHMLMYSFQLAIPAIFFAVLMISLNLCGDGLRDALDPKQRRS
ncbi:MAG: ABC transporter permease [Lachnospiraceae bacterium]|nr:ABC transporter permease [Lachnospiraceae bacterium]